jgi:putative transcriptional regulator
MSAEARHRAALDDPDAQPLTDADFARMKRTPQAKLIRRALDLTQEEFAARYHIPLGTLRDWEQGRAEPDQATRIAYLTVIARDPEVRATGVSRRAGHPGVEADASPEAPQPCSTDGPVRVPASDGTGSRPNSARSSARVNSLIHPFAQALFGPFAVHRQPPHET